MKIALTGGIACGKSLLSHYLNVRGIETLDADAVVHELIPDPAERRHLAAEVFGDSEKRRALEARLHPLVKARLTAWLDEPSRQLRIAVIPLLFEVHWEEEFDIIACIRSERETQIARMISNRGYSRSEAEARLAAQLPVAVKAQKSQYVINNDGSAEDLEREAEKFISWLKNSMCLPVP